MDVVLKEEMKRMAQFGIVIDRMEKLTLSLSDDLAKFQLKITEANKECRELIIEEGKQLNHLIQEMQAEKLLVDEEIKSHEERLKKHQ